MKGATNTAIIEVDTHKIIPPKDELRKQAKEEGLLELWRSMKHTGQLAPLIVRKTRSGKLELIIGSRRLQATRRFSRNSTIPVILADKITDAQALIMALSENLQREDLTPFEEAWGVFKLVNDYNLGIMETAKKIGRSEQFVRNRLQLLTLPAEVQRGLARREISMSQVNTLTSLREPQKQIEYARKVKREKLSDQELVTLIRKDRNAGTPQPSRQAKKGVYSGQRISLRVDGLAAWLESVEPHVAKMPGAHLHNLELSLKHMIRTANKLLATIDKAS